MSRTPSKPDLSSAARWADQRRDSDVDIDYAAREPHHEGLDALVRLLARQAARAYLAQSAKEGEDTP